MANHKATRVAEMSRKQKARELMLEGDSAMSIATKLGVHVTCVYKWRTQPEFAARLEREHERRQAMSADKLKSYVNLAIETLVEVMKDVKAPPPARVKASTEILDRAGITSKAPPSTVMIQRTTAPDEETLRLAKEYLAAQPAAKEPAK